MGMGLDSINKKKLLALVSIVVVFGLLFSPFPGIDAVIISLTNLSTTFDSFHVSDITQTLSILVQDPSAVVLVGSDPAFTETGSALYSVSPHSDELRKIDPFDGSTISSIPITAVDGFVDSPGFNAYQCLVYLFQIIHQGFFYAFNFL